MPKDSIQVLARPLTPTKKPFFRLPRFFGQIRNFNQEKGFGFIESEQVVPQFGGSDVFLHYTEALNFRVGDYVTFEVQIGEGGKPQAKALQLSNNMVMGGGGGMGMMSELFTVGLSGNF